jgi:hypothetical protein
MTTMWKRPTLYSSSLFSRTEVQKSEMTSALGTKKSSGGSEPRNINSHNALNITHHTARMRATFALQTLHENTVPEVNFYIIMDAIVSRICELESCGPCIQPA